MRLTTLYLVVGLPNTDEATECPTCGFDSLLRFPLTALSERGVGDFGYFSACGRCYDGGSDDAS